MTPTAHASDGRPYASPLTSSGDRKSGVPQRVVASASLPGPPPPPPPPSEEAEEEEEAASEALQMATRLARPRSPTTTLPPQSRKTLAAEMSRCSTPRSCMKSTAAASCEGWVGGRGGAAHHREEEEEEGGGGMPPNGCGRDLREPLGDEDVLETPPLLALDDQLDGAAARVTSSRMHLRWSSAAKTATWAACG